MSEKVTLLPVTREKKPVEDASAEDTSTEAFTIVNTSPWETIQSLSVFQGAIYASYVLTFCLAGFASVVLYRKALKTKVFRFSMGAKILALAFVGVALNSFFAAYLFNNHMNGGDINAPVICGMLIWALIGPAIAIILNSLLTREDSPGKMKVVLDVFVYLVIFGCIVASMAPDIEKNTSLVFSFFGAFFFIIPVARFLTALSAAKIRHPEVREMFIQILIYVLLFLPVLLPALAVANAYELLNSELKLFLINFITFNFILIGGLLMVIAIDYVTQGINLEPTVKVATGPTIETDAVSSPQTFKSEDVPVTPVARPAPAPVPEPQKPIEFSAETFEPKIANLSKSKNTSSEVSKRPEPQKANPDPVVPDTQKTSGSEEIPKPLKLPKSSEPISRIKAPNKPKKRF